MKNLTLKFSDREYDKLRNIRQRIIRGKFYKLFRLLAKILNFSYDFFILDLREPEPKIFTLNNRNFEFYKSVQIEANKRKLDNNKGVNWDRHLLPIVEDIVRFTDIGLSKSIIKGACLGARNGSEVYSFKKLLNNNFKKLGKKIDSSIIGTDISPSAEDFENMIVHDFHDRLPLKFGRMDFIYTNSLDQANDPKKALNSWIESISKEGHIYIEYSRGHGKRTFSVLDPFSCELELFPYVFLTWMSGKAYISRVIKSKIVNNKVVFVIKKN